MILEQINKDNVQAFKDKNTLVKDIISIIKSRAKLVEVEKRTKNEVLYKYIDFKETDVFKNKKYFIRTYGCQMNVHDSEEIKALLETIGYEETFEMEDSDLIIFD